MPRGRPRKLNLDREDKPGFSDGAWEKKCTICSQVFTKESKLQKHLREHELNDKPHRCDQCPQTFNVEFNLTLHKSTHTTSDFTCPVCNKKFSRIAGLKSHVMLHKKEENLICSECGDEFVLQSQLSLHLEEHRKELSGVRVYACKSCSKEFKTFAEYREHTKSHVKMRALSSSSRNYKKNIDRSGFTNSCHHCGKAFKKPSQLVRHIRIHTGERPYKCTHCNKAFNQKVVLQTHMVKHTGEKPHLCIYCPASFSQKGNLHSHVQRVHSETINPDEDDEDTEPRVVHPKTDEQRCRLQEACRDILLFKTLDQEQFSQVLDAMFESKVQPQEHVIDQGHDGDNFYVIERGIYDIVVSGKCVGQYNNKGSFGELALMYNTPRAATIIATQEGALWGLDRATFRRLIVKNNAKKRRMYECFIESVPLLKSLEVTERMKLVDVLGMKQFSDGERIITQGDKADCFYIVESGEVKIMMKSKTKAGHADNAEVEITRCSRGQYFGELALVANKPRAASAYAVGDVKCLVIDVQAFERLLGSCKEIMKRNIAHYEEQLVALFGSSMDLRD